MNPCPSVLTPLCPPPPVPQVPALIRTVVAGFSMAVAALAISGPALASVATADTGVDYVVSNWQLADGLPQSSVQALAQTPDGYLWLGTQAGLVRFDGVRFTLLGEPEATALKGANIWSLHADRDGTLWVGTFKGELLRMVGGVVSSVEAPIRTPIAGIHEDSSGAIWVATYGSGLIRVWQGHSTRYQTADGLPSDVVTALTSDREGGLWVATEQGLARWEDGGFAAVRHPALTTVGRIASLAIDADGRLWLGAKHGLFRRTDERWIRIDRPAENLGPTPSQTVKEDTDLAIWRQVMSLHTTRRGDLLIGAFGGVWRRLARTDATAAYPALLTNESQTTSLLEDREGNVWVGTATRGLYRLTPRSVTMMGVAQGLSHEAIRRVLADSSGSIWIGTEKGLNRLTDSGIAPYVSGRVGPHEAILELSEDRAGALWVQTSTGAYRMRGEELQPVVIDAEAENVTVNHHYHDPQGRLWVGSPVGLAKVDGGQITRYTTDEGLSDNWIRAIEPGSPGQLWVGTRKGLDRLSLSSNQFVHESAVPDVAISRLLQGRSGDLWIATQGSGLMRLRAGTLTTISSRQGLPSDNICQITEDNAGHLWLGTNQGIVRLNLRDIDELADTPELSIPVRIFDEADGMDSRECAGKVQASDGPFSDGRLWFGTVRGVAVIDPSRLDHNEVQPNVIVETLLVDRVPQAMKSEIRLPPSSRSYALQYTATSLGAPQKVRFKVRLDGFDEGWVDAGHQRVAYYTNLPHGSYRFRVLASNEDGVWSTREASLAFSVLAPFHRTPVFYALISIAVALLLMLAHHFRTVSLRAHNAVLLERNRIAREIHDTLAQGLIAIKVQIEVAKESIERAPTLAFAHLNRAQALADASVEEAHHSVWALRGGADAEADLAGAVTRMAEALTLHDPISVSVRVEGDPPTLDSERFLQLLRLLREAVANVVRHAHAQHLAVEIKNHDGTLKVTVSDDGRGFVPGAGWVERDFGLTGMRERAQRIGASFALTSAPGAGTVVEVTLPCVGPGQALHDQ